MKYLKFLLKREMNNEETLPITIRHPQFQNNVYLCALKTIQGEPTMTQLTLNVTDESLIPMLRKLFRSIEGVEVATKRRKKSGIELAYEDLEAGRVYYAKDGSDLIRQCLDN